jgi:hypothetical protein
LALQYHNLERAPLFATATRDVLVLFKDIERGKLEKIIVIKSIGSPDCVRAFKRGAYVELLKNYLLTEKVYRNGAFSAITNLCIGRPVESKLSTQV